MQPQQGGGSNNTLLIVVIAILAIALAGGGIFFLTQSDDDDDASGGGNGDDQTSDTTAAPSDDPLRQEYVDALGASFTSTDLSQMGASEGDIPCIAGAMVDAIGLERLQELGTPDEMRNNTASEPTDEELQSGIEAAFDCLDLRGLFQDEFVSRGMSETEAQCVLDQLSDDQVEDLMVAGLNQDEPAATALLEPAMGACGLA